MHWAGVSTVGVQSEQVVIQSLSQVHISKRVFSGTRSTGLQKRHRY